jgi:hypothetical protein
MVARAAAATDCGEQQPKHQDGGTQCPFPSPPFHAPLAPLSRPIDQTEQSHSREGSENHVSRRRHV